MTRTESDRMKTRCVFEAGFAMTRGLRLEELEVVNGNSRPQSSVTFVMAGEGASEIADEYQRGRAQADVRLLKDAIDFLRKRLFAAIDHGARR